MTKKTPAGDLTFWQDVALNVALTTMVLIFIIGLITTVFHVGNFLIEKYPYHSHEKCSVHSHRANCRAEEAWREKLEEFEKRRLEIQPVTR
mgnify:CR=1 FL=1|jgi:hypothetical protein|tara:strand:+ start:20606 stop:20878 length:273 start_codon:yes stop_codon:yes gene_type:complete